MFFLRFENISNALNLITVSRTVNFDNNGEIAGVLGTDYFMSQFGETVLSGNTGEDQMIVDAAGYVIYHPQFSSNRNPEGHNLINVKFKEIDGSISDPEPNSVTEIWSENARLADTLLNAGFPLMQCHDVINFRTRKSLDFERYFEENGNVEILKIGGVEISHLEGTNAFILKGKKLELMTSNDENFEWSNTTDRWPIIERAQVAMDASNYYQCENKFLGGASIPACQGSSPGLDIGYLGDFNWTTGFSGEDVSKLGSCFGYMQGRSVKTVSG